MTATKKLREHSFWISEKLKGGKIHAHYQDILSIVNYYDDPDNKAKKEQYLNEIIDHAVHTVPYYQNLIGKSINDFPVIDKNIIRQSFNDFRSRSRLYESAATLVTSGSTGTPFSIEQDKRKRERNTADTIFFGELAGFTIGQKLFYFKIWNEINRKGKLAGFIQNIVPFDVRDLSEKHISEFIKAISKDKSEKSLLAYASVFDSICIYLERIGSVPIHCNLKAIIAMSEAFSISTKKLLLKYFNVHAVSRYSNVENGILAQQVPDGSNEFVINEASYFFEVLEMNSDNPVTPGTPGRIVITDLFNYCMPMIRYDTGDIGTISQKDVLNYLRPVFKSIEGRKMDLIFDTAGSLVSSFVITNNMWKYTEIDQYQFIQLSPKDYMFKINISKPFKREPELIAEFTQYFGKDANISVEYVREIPLLDSGKRKKVVNLCKL